MPEASLRTITRTERRLIEETLARGRSILDKAGIALAADAEPIEVVTALEKWAKANHAKRVAPALTGALGFLFCEQIVRASANAWRARVFGRNVDLRVYTKDHYISVGPKGPVKGAIDPSLRRLYTLGGLFAAMTKVAARGEDHAKLLSAKEAKHLYDGDPFSWPVWEVHFALEPTKLTRSSTKKSRRVRLVPR